VLQDITTLAKGAQVGIPGSLRQAGTIEAMHLVD